MDAGTNGANFEEAIFNRCQLCEYNVADQLGITVPEPIVPGVSALPYFLLGDNAFAARKHSRMGVLNQACRVVEIAVGILAS